jgi:hypothetical protein
VKGRVTEEQGHGLEGVTITAHCGVGSLRPTGEAKSDAEGRYTLRFREGMSIQRDGQWVVGVQAATISPRKPGFFETNLHRGGDLLMADKLSAPGENVGWKVDPAKVVLPNQPYELNFVLLPAATLEGRLVDANNQPLTNRNIHLTGDQLPPSSSVLASVTTDADGRFRFENVPTSFPWKYGITDEGKEVLSRPYLFIMPGEQRVELRFRRRTISTFSRLDETSYSGSPRVLDSTAQFGPVIEREMKPAAGLEQSYLDLETGDFVTNAPPGDVTLFPGESDLRVRHGLDMVASIVSSDAWDNSAGEVKVMVEILQHSIMPEQEMRLGGPELRRTWMIRTREGTPGVLQIVPVEEKPGTVRSANDPGSSRREAAPSERQKAEGGSRNS